MKYIVGIAIRITVHGQFGKLNPSTIVTERAKDYLAKVTVFFNLYYIVVKGCHIPMNIIIFTLRL